MGRVQDGPVSQNESTVVNSLFVSSGEDFSRKLQQFWELEDVSCEVEKP